VSPAITMTGAITALVAEKRATGYKYDAEDRVLARFAAFCASQFPGLEAPTRTSVEAWIAAARQRGVKHRRRVRAAVGAPRRRERHPRPQAGRRRAGGRDPR
jgi:hypothetical protein